MRRDRSIKLDLISICYITDSQSLFVHVCCKYFVFYRFIVVCLNALHSYGGNKSIYRTNSVPIVRVLNYDLIDLSTNIDEVVQT